MLESIVTGCHWLLPSPQLMFDQDTPLAIASALMTTNLAVVVISCRRLFDAKTSRRTRPVDPLKVWQASNVSIALWLLCLVALRMGAQ